MATEKESKLSVGLVLNMKALSITPMIAESMMFSFQVKDRKEAMKIEEDLVLAIEVVLRKHKVSNLVATRTSRYEKLKEGEHAGNADQS